MQPSRLTILLATALSLSACATPRYQTVYRYEPPTDAAGLACLTPCEQVLKACQNDCASRYATCVQALEPEAKLRFDDAIKRYEGELTQYRRDLNRYHLSISLGWGHYDGWYGAGWYDPWWPYGGYYGARFYPPIPPEPPSYAEEFGKLRAEKCDRDCGCQSNYDACFLHCGGTKIPETRCIANCPPEERKQ